MTSRDFLEHADQAAALALLHVMVVRADHVTYVVPLKCADVDASELAAAKWSSLDT